MFVWCSGCVVYVFHPPKPSLPSSVFCFSFYVIPPSIPPVPYLFFYPGSFFLLILLCVCVGGCLCMCYHHPYPLLSSLSLLLNPFLFYFLIYPFNPIPYFLSIQFFPMYKCVSVYVCVFYWHHYFSYCHDYLYIFISLYITPTSNRSLAFYIYLSVYCFPWLPSLSHVPHPFTEH